MSWKILLYETPLGKPMIERFLAKLKLQTRQKAARQFDLLAEYGINLGMPHSRPLGDGLYELRIRGNQEVRVFYVFAVEKNIYLLHGFQKNSQTTPTQELKIARKRQKEIEKL